MSTSQTNHKRNLRRVPFYLHPEADRALIAHLEAQPKSRRGAEVRRLMLLGLSGAPAQQILVPASPMPSAQTQQADTSQANAATPNDIRSKLKRAFG